MLKLRQANIRRNEEELKRLGLDVGGTLHNTDTVESIDRGDRSLRAVTRVRLSTGLTVSAIGKMKPTAATRRRRAVPYVYDGTERRSGRNLGKEVGTRSALHSADSVTTTHFSHLSRALYVTLCP